METIYLIPYTILSISLGGFIHWLLNKPKSKGKIKVSDVLDKSLIENIQGLNENLENAIKNIEVIKKHV